MCKEQHVDGQQCASKVQHVVEEQHASEVQHLDEQHASEVSICKGIYWHRLDLGCKRATTAFITDRFKNLSANRTALSLQVKIVDDGSARMGIGLDGGNASKPRYLVGWNPKSLGHHSDGTVPLDAPCNVINKFGIDAGGVTTTWRLSNDELRWRTFWSRVVQW